MAKPLEIFQREAKAAYEKSEHANTGFRYIDHDPFPMVEVKLNGHSLSM